MQLRHSPYSFRAQALGLVGWLCVTFAATAIASVDASFFYVDLRNIVLGQLDRQNQ